MHHSAKRLFKRLVDRSVTLALVRQRNEYARVRAICGKSRNQFIDGRCSDIEAVDQRACVFERTRLTHALYGFVDLFFTVLHGFAYPRFIVSVDKAEIGNFRAQSIVHAAVDQVFKLIAGNVCLPKACDLLYEPRLKARTGGCFPVAFELFFMLAEDVCHQHRTSAFIDHARSGAAALLKYAAAETLGGDDTEPERTFEAQSTQQAQFGLKRELVWNDDKDAACVVPPQ